MDTLEQLRNLPVVTDQDQFENFVEATQPVQVLKIGRFEKILLGFSKWVLPKRFRMHFDAIIEKATEYEAIQLSLGALNKPKSECAQ